MTGYTVHTGASKKFVSGWDRIFAAESTTEEPKAKKKKQRKKNAKKKPGK